MRLTQISSHFLTLTTLLLSQRAAAALIPELLQHLDVFSGLEKRCANPCGYNGWLCCGSNQYCYTDTAGQAQCGTGSQGNSGGSWVYATTTYVQTDLKTVTATYSSYVGGTTQAPSNQCSYAQGQTLCGSTCCNSGYYCQSSNMCVQVPGGSSGYYGGGIYTVTTVITNTAGVPLRPTTQTVLTLTSTGTGVVGTTAYQTAVGTSGAVLGASTGSGGGLSGGAIAGIVLGVIFGIILLLLICACCCFKGLIDGFLNIFCGRRKRVTEETIIEERHSRRNGFGRTWFGRPGRTEVVEEKTSGGWGKALGVTAFLGTTAALLGLKRERDRRKGGTNSSYSYSDYSYDYTSDSSPSSITRTSRRSRR